METEKISLRNLICDITYKHLKKYKSFIFGQNLLGVGLVDGTLPKNLKEKDGVVDLPMADVAGGGIVVGSALLGRKPFYIIRYQGYNWFNMIFIINYACKSKSIWKKPAPIFIRGIANEGSVGPVAGSAHISQFYKMPGIKIFSPITAKEYLRVYNEFLSDNEVYYISEHRKTFSNSGTFKNSYCKNPEITLILNSITRHLEIDILDFAKNIKLRISIIHIFRIKPLFLSILDKKILSSTKKGIIICDNDYIEGMPSIISAKIMNLVNCNIYLMGLKNKTAGHHPKKDLLPPSSLDLINKIKKVLDLN
jgi:pyruvate/2-oxoglutarate/acetoin dehydrogenase E1 component